MDDELGLNGYPIVVCLNGMMNDRQSCVVQYGIEQYIAIDASLLCMRSIIEFDGHQRRHVAQTHDDEVDGLLRNARPTRITPVMGLGEPVDLHQPIQRHMHHYRISHGHCVTQHGIERLFGDRDDARHIA